MPEIGKSLIFYLKYFSEMQALYEEKGSLPGLEKAEEYDSISKKVEAVGKQASSEAADLLLKCAADFRSRLEGSGVVTIKACRRITMERKWQVIFDLLPSRGRKPNGITHQFGLYLEPSGITPWLWSRGGRAAEERIRTLLPGVEFIGSKQLDWSSGSVGLRPIIIPWQTASDFLVEADPVVAETTSRLKAITPDFATRFISQD